MVNIIKQGENVIKAHLEHLKSHNQGQYLKEAIDFLKEKKINVYEGFIKQESKYISVHLEGGCPGARIMDFSKQK